MERYGERIREIRRSQRLTQLDLAAKIGMRNYTLSLIESDKRMPTASEVDKLARALEVTPNDIIRPVTASISA